MYGEMLYVQHSENNKGRPLFDKQDRGEGLHSSGIFMFLFERKTSSHRL
jgi:hypothetical protein